MLGRGIAACLLSRGFRVIGYTRSAASFSAARTYITNAIDDLVIRGGFPASLREQWKPRYHEVATLADFRTCDLVIENVVEDPDAKRAVFDAWRRRWGLSAR